MRARLLILSMLALAFATPLVAAEIHDATTRQDAARVQRILARDPSQAIAADQSGNTPLHLAAANGSVDLLRMLLDAGAPVDVGDADNSTPLDVAAQQGRIDAVKLLVESGADVLHRDNNGMTPLHFACYEGHDDAAAFLLERGADPTATTTRGSIPLHGAAVGGHGAVVALLLDHGSPVNVINLAGYTPLVSGCYGRADLETIRALVDRGAYVGQRAAEGFTPLHYMAWRGDVEALRYLAERGASLDALTDGIGNPPLHMVIDGGDRPDAVRALLDAGARIEATNAWGATALYWAAMQGRDEIARLLLERGAEADVTINDGKSALFTAIRNGHMPVAGMLLEAGAKPDDIERDAHRTALHMAALQGQADVATLLLEHGADPRVLDNYGATAVQYAARYGHPDVVDALRSHGADCSNIEECYGRPALLDRKLEDGEAALWYLGHCSWAIKTKKHLLVFDYWQRSAGGPHAGLLDGRIVPEEVRDQNVIAFVTHEHQDHYDPTIFEWSQALPHLEYVFGFRPEELPDNRGTDFQCPDYTYVGPHEMAKVGGAEVRTIVANDAGVGFLVKVDGVVIYHAGDHAGWADDQREGYIAEIDYLDPLADGLDIAFLNVTGCHAHDPARLREGNVYTLDTLKPRVMVPTHAADQEQVYATKAQELVDAGATTPIAYPVNRGDSFLYTNGTMTMTR